MASISAAIGQLISATAVADPLFKSSAVFFEEYFARSVQLVLQAPLMGVLPVWWHG